jgi:hypothetical protein
MSVSAHLLCGRFALLGVISLSLFATRFGRCSGLITGRLFLLVHLRLLGAWFGGGFFRGRLGLSFWLFLDASRTTRGNVSVSGGGSGFRFSNHDNRRWELEERESWSFAAAVNALLTEGHVTMLIAFDFDLRPNFPRVRWLNSDHLYRKRY